ncbi:unnamed protein product [Brugia timori]|uniref:DUF2577 domain-containing protein n=1 Tax=Brugia timori TaxID=42155 RepID=A0A0R3R155_9BILA|nr:unnamed protein product [Brugia timori]
MQAVSYQVNPEYAKLSQIVPGLFICGISELNQHNIERNGITMIINATDELMIGEESTIMYQKDDRVAKMLSIYLLSDIGRPDILMTNNWRNDLVPNLKTLGNILRIKLWINDTPETDIYLHLEAVSDQVE